MLKDSFQQVLVEKDTSALDGLFAIVSEEQTSVEHRSSVARLLSVVVSNDKCRQHFLSEPFISAFLKWLQNAEVEDLIMTGALCLGNLARSDDDCLNLLEANPGLLTQLLDCLRRDSLNVRHAVIGALRNLSISSTIWV
jgi:hypothetical protein